MIVNLIGHIASGKTTFAKWFVEHNNNWIHIDIAEIRREIAQLYKLSEYAEYISDAEEEVWQKIYTLATSYKNSIIETTGTSHKLQRLWTPELANRGIYTIKFVATLNECQERIAKRDRIMVPGYDMHESYYISIEDEWQKEIPTNLIVNTSNTDDQIYTDVFVEICEYIQKSCEYFSMLEKVFVIGVNSIN